MEDELRESIINEVVGLKSNIYSLISVNIKKVKKAKGINENKTQKIFRSVVWQRLNEA